MSNQDLPQWNTDDDNFTEPPAAKKQAGAKGGKEEAAGYINWALNKTWKWFRGLFGAYADIVVGVTAEVTAKTATHTLDNFVAAIANNDKILFRDSVAADALARNEDITESGIRIRLESAAAVVAFSTFSLTISGDNFDVQMATSGAGTGDIILSGDGGKFEHVGAIALPIFTMNGFSIVIAPGDADASGGIAVNGEITINGDTVMAGGGDVLLEVTPVPRSTVGVFKTYTVPADFLAANDKGFRITAWGFRSGAGGSSTINFRTGTTPTVRFTQSVGTGNTDWRFEFLLVRDGSTTAALAIKRILDTAILIDTIAITTDTDWSVAQTLDVNLSVVNGADTITMQGWHIEAIG